MGCYTQLHRVVPLADRAVVVPHKAAARHLIVAPIVQCIGVELDGHCLWGSSANFHIPSLATY